MHTLDLGVEQRVRIDAVAAILANEGCGIPLRLLLDLCEILKKRRIVGVWFQVGDFPIVGYPAISDRLGDLLRQGWICVQQPSPLGDAVGLVVEAIREDQIEFGEHFALQQFRMEGSHTIGAVAADDGEIGHDEFAGYNGFIFTDYRGMTVEQISKIRKELMKSQGNYRVVKNRFAKIALNQLDHKGCDAHLKGPTGIALVKGDTTNVIAKELFAAKEDGSPIDIKGALIDGQILDVKQLEAYSKLPSRNELLSILMGTMKAPIQKLAATLLAHA